MAGDRATRGLLGCGVIGPVLFAVGDRGWTLYSIASGVGVVAFFLAANAGANGAAGLGDVAGLLQRVSIAIGFAWIAVLAAWLMRTSAPAIAYRTTVGPDAG